MLWRDGSLYPDQLGPVVEELLIEVLTDRAIDCVRPGHFLTALMDHLDQDCRVVLTTALRERVRLEELPEAIEAYCPHVSEGASSGPGLVGRREDFSPEALAALDDVGVMLEGGGDDIPATAPGQLTPAHLWFAVLRHPDEDDRRWLGERLLDIERAREGFERVISPRTSAPELFDPSTGQMLLDHYQEGAITALCEAAQLAGRMGFDRIMPAHLFLALLLQPESPMEWSVRLEAPEGHGPEHVVGEVRRHLLAGREPSGSSLPLDRDHAAEGTRSERPRPSRFRRRLMEATHD